MVRLKNWSVYDDGSYHLQGNVYGHPRFDDGDLIDTSRIVSIIDKGDHKEITTQSGTVYSLYADEVGTEIGESLKWLYFLLTKQRRIPW